MPEAVSRIDVGQGRLYFRGRDAVELAETCSYESVLYLLCEGRSPSRSQLRLMRSQMSEVQERMASRAISIGSEADSCAAALAKQASAWDELGSTPYECLLAFVTLAPLTACACWRKSHALEPIPPKADLGHAANVLWMMGRPASKKDRNQFETCLVMHMDDPDNPSLSTLQRSIRGGKTIARALVAAVEDHVNPLHHGAGTLAMEMLSELRTSADMKTLLGEWIREGKRIYGLGHRIYKTIDPRATALRDILINRAKNTPDEWLIAATDAVATIGSQLLLHHKKRELFPNVDLYNAAVYSTFGLPPEFNTELFAISRAAGWMAHIMDMKREN